MSRARSAATSAGRRADMTIASGQRASRAAAAFASASASPTRSILLKTSRRGTSPAPISASTSARDLELALEARVGGVDDVRQQARLQRLVERALERRHQAVGQLVDEPDRVRDQDARVRLRVQRAHGRVEGREQLVGDVDLAAGERPHERRLAGVRVADQRDPAHVAAARALRPLLLGEARELARQLGDAIADLAPVQLQARLARPLAADAAALRDPCPWPCPARAGAAPGTAGARSPPGPWRRASGRGGGRSPGSRRCDP